jgi:uncharacterized surface protein with fasciclin (FAS1) repeats
MKIPRRILGVAPLAALLLVLTGCNDDDDPVGPTPAGDIVEVAVATPSLSTLVTALQAAGLVEVLQGEGPFTVFAPTNAAFEALPPGTLESLLDDPDALASVLTYHVAAGELRSGDVAAAQSVQTLNGESVEVSVMNGGVRLNGVSVSIVDVEASNGVIHIIDGVLLPQGS